MEQKFLISLRFSVIKFVEQRFTQNSQNGPKFNTWLLSWRNISFQLSPLVYAPTDILFCIPGEINNKNGKINQFLFWPKKYKFWPQKMPNAQNVPNSITLIQIVFHRLPQWSYAVERGKRENSKCYYAISSNFNRNIKF